MRIAIIGLGGVGGYFGGKLACEYSDSNQHEIIFIARGEHLNAIRKNGLHLFTREGECIARPQIVTDNPAEAGVFDLVLFCTKSYSLEKAAELYRSCINRNTIVIPLLNGVNNAERLRVILPETHILSGSVYIISHLERPGVVCQKEGPCALVFGTDGECDSQYQYILDVLLQAKINAVLTDKISEALWAKYILICPLAALTAVTGKTYGAVLADTSLRKKMKSMMKEALIIARARKIVLPDDCIDKTIEVLESVDYDNKTSFQLDIEQGKQAELDIMPEYLCESGRKLGILTPLHDEIYAQLKKNIIYGRQSI